MRVFLAEYLLHLFHWTWQTSLVAGAVLLVSRLASGTSARFRAAILGLAFWKFLLPPMLPLPTGLFSRVHLFGTEWSGGGSWFAGVVLAVQIVGSLAGVMRIRSARDVLNSRLRGARRSGRFRLAVAPADQAPRVPVAFGFFRPAIVLPRRAVAGMSRAERHIVLAHERRHLELAHGLAAAAEAWLGAIWWFHPFWWLIVRERRLVREERCDEDVVARLRLDPATYASCLVRVAELCGGGAETRWLPAMAGGARGIAARLNRLRRPAPRWSVLELASALALYAALLPGIRPWPSAARHRAPIESGTRAH